MGLLDELEQQAERRRQEEAKADVEREARDAVWREKLRPSMAALAGYLKKLTDNLTFLKRRTRLVFPLAGYGDVVAMLDPVWTLRDEPGKTQHDINVECFAVVASEESANVEAEGLGRVRALSGLFQTHRIGGPQDARKNANGDVVAARFQARGKIALKVAITADKDSGVCRMQFVNYEGMNTTTRTFAPEAMTEAMFDALGRFIAHEDKEFAREKVDDGVRKHLQTQIQRAQLKREWENKLARQLEDDEARVLSFMGAASSPGSVLGGCGWQRARSSGAEGRRSKRAPIPAFPASGGRRSDVPRPAPSPACGEGWDGGPALLQRNFANNPSRSRLTLSASRRPRYS